MEQLKDLPPVAWLLIAAAAVLGFVAFWAWSWYSRYRARKALQAAVTGSAADHLRDSLVPDGMGGSFHIDYLLLTLRGVVVIDLRDVSFVDSAGVSALVKVRQEARARALEVHAVLGGAQDRINATVVELLRRVLPCDD